MSSEIFAHCYDCNIPKECTKLGHCYFRPPVKQMTHNLKGGVGPFKIFHIGKMTYAVERDGKVLDTVENISNAYRSAERFQRQAKEEQQP